MDKTTQQIIDKFAELQKQGEAIQLQPSDTWTGTFAPSGSWEGWAISSLSLINIAFGGGTPHFIYFNKAYEDCNGSGYCIAKLKDLLKAAKNDYEQGFAVSFEKKISGELFGDFVVAAKTALKDGNKDVAAVLACAALEDALKRFASLNDLEVQDKSMQDIVNALKSKGLVSGAKKALLDAMPKIRDYAMHAHWNKITPEDVGSVIGFVDQFLLENF